MSERRAIIIDGVLWVEHDGAFRETCYNNDFYYANPDCGKPLDQIARDEYHCDIILMALPLQWVQPWPTDIQH